MCRRTAVVLVALALLGGLGPAPRPAQAHATEKVGLLLVDHGEPPRYNARTYWSFRAFLAHLVELGAIPRWLTVHDTGTILHEDDCYGCATDGADLVDAWVRPHDGPAAAVPRSQQLPAHYVTPGGPGLGEPDFYEHAGHQIREEWRQMGGWSPNYAQKLAKKQAAVERLRATYTDAELPISVGYHIDPHTRGSLGIRAAVEQLVAQHVGHIVVAYHGVGFSDIMQTHMIRHEIEAVLNETAPDVTVRYAKPMGSTRSYVRAVVQKAQAELSAVRPAADVAIHLSGHGMSTTTCGSYDCGGDQYHAYSKALFRRTKRAILASVERPGRLGIFHVYGEGGDEEHDPDDLVDSPKEALAKRTASRFDRVVDIPYEFDSDSRDTLVVLRAGYDQPVPGRDDSYVSRFRYRGMPVKITNSQFGHSLKVRALLAVIEHGLAAKTPSEPHH